MSKNQKYEGTALERRRQASKTWKERNPEKVLNKRYKLRYGITYDQYKEMLKKQEHKCAICGIDELESRDEKLCVDHCHETGKVRMLLCNNCNCGLGLFKDDASILELAAAYLKMKW